MTNESMPLGVIISRTKIIELCLSIIVITAVSDRVIVAYIIVRTADDTAVSVSVVSILDYIFARLAVYRYYVTHQIASVVITLVRRAVI